jgi:hypothetical protein
MKIQKDIVVPASIRTQWSWVCDDCGTEMGGMYKCDECGAEVCHKCSKLHPDDTGGDHESTICRPCLEIFKSYEQEIWELESKIDDIKQRRTEQCKTARKKKNEVNKT